MNRSLSLLLLLLLMGCQYNPFVHRFLTREPAQKEVVGQYQLKEVRVDMVERGLAQRIRSKTPAPTITLYTDGRATLNNFPYIEKQEGTFNYKFKGFEDLTARWKISPVGGVSAGGKDGKTVYGLRLTLTDGRQLFDSPVFTGKEQVDGIIFTLYDGDQGQILGFVKTNAEQPSNARSPSAPVVGGR